MRTRKLALITVFGLGHLRPAPGTWGSLPPIVAGTLLLALGLGPQAAPVAWIGAMATFIVVFSAACVVQGDRAEGVFGRKDPSQVVADETAGQAVAILWLPGAATQLTAGTVFTLAFAFIAFRIFDIIKPWPAHGLQRIPGGWGILIDDLLAGVYALCLVHFCFWLAT